MFVRSKSEAQFLFSKLNKEQRLLEYGCGASTIQFCQFVKEVVSVENDLWWGQTTINVCDKNVQIIHVDMKVKGVHYHDGGKNNFLSYIYAPLMLSPHIFDVIYIDGRARPWCAEASYLFSHKDTKIFIHDFNTEDPTRKQYGLVTQWLDIVACEHTLYEFRVKKELLWKQYW